MKKNWLIIVFLLLLSSLSFAQDSDYQTLRTFMSAQMYGEAYNELMQRELAGLVLDSKLKSLKIDLLDRTNLKLQKQAKASPDDPTVFTILADIAFQKGDYDRASMYISTAINNNGNAISNYVFAKILFRKGKISQAFDQMSKVLEAMPDSLIVFNDFQFLYNCKQYGVNTAKKITKDSTFLIRSTPIAYENEEVEIPESPFANDPTESVNTPDFSDYNTASNNDENENYSNDNDLEDELSELSQIDISLESEKDKKPIIIAQKPKEEKKVTLVEKTKDEKKNTLAEKEEENEFGFSDSDFGFDDSNDNITIKEDKKNTVNIETKVSKSKDEEEDPEINKLQEAEKLFASANAKYNNDNFDTALLNIRDLKKIEPNYPGLSDLENKVNYEIKLRKNYKEGKEILKNSDFKNYDKAIKYIKDAYNKSPKKFPDAPFYLGDAYSSKDNPDYEQALYYYNIIEKDPDLKPEDKRDILWRKFEIYMFQEKMNEANELYTYFNNNEKEYLKEHGDWTLLYKFLWYNYSIIIIIIFIIIIVLVFSVFVLQFLPDLSIIGGNPLNNSQKALNNARYDKAIKIAERALRKKQPIQIDRQLREVLVQAYFELEKYKECIEHSRKILETFPENPIAWAHIAKASIEIQDTSNEAIKMYEDMYRNDPTKKEILPMLAHYYAKSQDTSSQAMEVLQDYYNAKPDDSEVVVALADGYVKNRTMEKEIVPILNSAIKLNDKLEYRELLARTFSKCGMYEEASRECINVLNQNINNIGIHVVYTSSMKKLKQIPKAIAQYKEFINANPNNNQLIEILDGLKKEEIDTSTPIEEVPSIFDSLGMPGLDELDEPPPETKKTSSTPFPDFLSESNETSQVQPNELPEGIQTLNPFADDDSLFDGFDTDELPEELGGTNRAPVETSKSLDSLIDDFNNSNPSNTSSIFDNNISDTPTTIRNNFTETPQNSGSLELAQRIEEARDLAAQKKWDKVTTILSPYFASERNREVGMLLIDAWLGCNKPEMALEIIHALDFDPEMLTEDIKDAMYKTAVALEMNKNYKEALHLYDTICNCDINYRDAFDKSDRLYVKMKG